VILPAQARYLPIPATSLALITVLHPDPTALCRETAMMRLSPGKFALLTAGKRDEQGMPVYWTPHDDGRGEVWPVPDREYRLRARDTAGRDPDAQAKPVNVFPVPETVEAINRQYAEAMAKRDEQTPEYFRRQMGARDE